MRLGEMRLLAKGGVMGREKHEMPPDIRHVTIKQMPARLASAEGMPSALKEVWPIRHACR
jgi:hypothetical protein